ncbi:unnamed protein product, partial [Pleuronectes platessa]
VVWCRTRVIRVERVRSAWYRYGIASAVVETQQPLVRLYACAGLAGVAQLAMVEAQLVVGGAWHLVYAVVEECQLSSGGLASTPCGVAQLAVVRGGQASVVEEAQLAVVEAQLWW